MIFQISDEILGLLIVYKFFRNKLTKVLWFTSELSMKTDLPLILMCHIDAAPRRNPNEPTSHQEMCHIYIPSFRHCYVLRVALICLLGHRPDGSSPAGLLDLPVHVSPWMWLLQSTYNGLARGLRRWPRRFRYSSTYALAKPKLGQGTWSLYAEMVLRNQKKKRKKERERNHVLGLFSLQIFLLTSFSCPVDCTHIKG